jgi:hypothetical protein
LSNVQSPENIQRDLLFSEDFQEMVVNANPGVFDSDFAVGRIH